MSKKKAAPADADETFEIPNKGEESPEPSPLDDLPKSESISKINADMAAAGVPITVVAPHVPITEVAPAPGPPSLGWIVIYTSAGEKSAAGEQHAALITAVNGDQVALRVFTSTADFIILNVRGSQHRAGSLGAVGCWTWPARV